MSKTEIDLQSITKTVIDNNRKGIPAQLDLLGKIDKLREEIKELKQKLDEEKAERTKALEKYLRDTSQHIETTNQLRKTVESQTIQLDSAAHYFEAIKQTLKKSEDEKNILIKEKVQTIQKEKDLQTRDWEHEKEMAKLKQDIEKLEKGKKEEISRREKYESLYLKKNQDLCDSLKTITAMEEKDNASKKQFADQKEILAKKEKEIDKLKQTMEAINKAKKSETEERERYQNLYLQKDKDMRDSLERITAMAGKEEELKKQIADQEERLTEKNIENNQLQEENVRLKKELAALTTSPMPAQPSAISFPSVAKNKFSFLRARMEKQKQELQEQKKKQLMVEQPAEPLSPVPTIDYREPNPGKTKQKKNKKKKKKEKSSSAVSGAALPSFSSVPCRTEKGLFAEEIKQRPKLTEYYRIVAKSGLTAEKFMELEKNAVKDQNSRKELYQIYVKCHKEKALRMQGGIFTEENKPIDAYISALRTLIALDKRNETGLTPCFKKLEFAAKIYSSSPGYPPAQYMLAELLSGYSGECNILLAKHTYEFAIKSGHPCATPERLAELTQKAKSEVAKITSYIP